MDVLIVGAGITGLTAARLLQQQGLDVVVLEKYPVVGGRLATLYLDGDAADTGAQFFTARDPLFQAQIADWEQHGLVYPWSYGWSDGSLAITRSDGHPRYAARGGMSALMHHLAEGLHVQTDTLLTTATPDDEYGWITQSDEGNVYVSRALLLTAPVPQSLIILDEGAAALEPRDRAVLDTIQYAPSVTAVFEIEGNIKLPEPGAMQRQFARVMWIADNARKGIARRTLVSVQASAQYSRHLMDMPDDYVLGTLHAGLIPLIRQGTTIRDAHLKRWLHAAPMTIHLERCLRAAKLPALVFAGDAFGGPRVEGAVLSGQAAALAIRRALGG